MIDLLKLCLGKGSKDNCTACLVQLLPGGEAKHSKELVQGSWPEASPEVQAKYAEFFAAHGFEEEARAIASGGGQAPPAPPPKPDAGDARPEANRGAGPAPGPAGQGPAGHAGRPDHPGGLARAALQLR